MPPRPRSTRRVLALLGLVLGGAVISLAVAWGCALWSPYKPRYVTTLELEYVPVGPQQGEARGDARPGEPAHMAVKRTLAEGVEYGWPDDPEVSARRARILSEVRPERMPRYHADTETDPLEVLQLVDGPGLTMDLLSCDIGSRSPASTDIFRVSAGWPAYCVRGTYGLTWTGREAAPLSWPDNIIYAPLWAHPAQLWIGSRILPYIPLWPGLLIDTSLYALALWLLIFLPGLARRAWRRRNGRCLHCNYDRRGLASAGSPCPECGLDASAVRAAHGG